ncbi:DUF1080 domain-containing protein [Algibacter amylolyticus]|uniref:DUF1080 domain-containing protein n=1 Tax=Algibacter amylolyticus TaxID=1608400 RepID=A0A5M7BFG4_9FLAO|nr:DUF1080 domain-containing protein [Algibacter amylolyticus]KAA5826374.1 DUF1080 domain-containing protein [Algibacter amylolyticus]MBB5268580.1 hypothetical protein [Algibacter amylolyticus]TSJ80412.1 DUF1080 domain-containing protein [Algibacter amylolyticus]
MKNKLLFLFAISLIISCEKEETKLLETVNEKEETLNTLPFTNIELEDLSDFRPTTKNWQIAGSVVANRSKEKTLIPDEGKGILINKNDQEQNKHIFSNFEHGDIELELDVMMPIKSNSGIYFQSRYEIQLFDSWGVEHAKHNDIGGVYQRWNKDAKKGKEGYEGHSPLVNAAKAPGLWQHLKIIFHAPKFNEKGEKIKNAWFEEVRLNNILIQKNVEVTGSTRASAAKEEVPYAPLMIQGDHGPVAFKNIKYKLYEDKKIGIEKSELKIYDNSKKLSVLKNIEDLKLLETHATDSISPLMRIDVRDQKVLSYSGKLDIPTSGDYLFEAAVNGGTYLIIENDTVMKMNGDFDMNTTQFNKVHLKKGQVTYNLVYNKPIIWRRGFDFFVEGPKMQRYSLLKTGTTTLSKNNPIKPITLNVTEKPLTQRSFLNHKGVKRSHCISVGLVEKLNYSLDLETGTLLHVWSGDFLDATQMWHSRGEHQRGEPMGFPISLHGDLDFASLNSKNDAWPKALSNNQTFKQIGYEFKNEGLPVFSFEINGNEISHNFKASAKAKRGIDRVITSESKSSMWHKIADGESIKVLENNTFIINNESYYIVFPDGETHKPIIRDNNGKNELLIEIPKGHSTINYTIIW